MQYGDLKSLKRKNGGKMPMYGKRVAFLLEATWTSRAKHFGGRP